MFAEDQPEVGQGRELTGLVENGRGHLQAVLRGVLGELVVPKAMSDRIGIRLYDAASKIGIGIEAREIDEGGARQVGGAHGPRRRCSVRGPQLSLQRCLNADTIPDAASALRASGTEAIGLKPTGCTVLPTLR